MSKGNPFLKHPSGLDPFHLMTPTMEMFSAGVSDYYINPEGFQITDNKDGKATIKCLACKANKTFIFVRDAGRATSQHELAAAEGVQWQFEHRRTCKQ